MRTWRIFKYSLIGLLLIAVLAGAGAIALLYTFGRDLPDVAQLADYEPPVTTRIYASDGQLLEEYARERRLFVPVSAMPEQLIDAFIAAEDQNFYAHPGVDFVGIGRAVITNIRNYATDRRPVGASTITQQVAKNFLLSNEVSYERKIKEALLAFRMEEAFTKDQILELYLNEIYLGQGAYGVAAASLYYFDKPLGELDLPEVAYLAALPKAPNNYHPIDDRQAAVARRNWVLGRMQEEGFITAEERAEAVATPLLVRRGRGVDLFEAAYFNEEVRRRLMGKFGQDKLYEGGLVVRTTLEPRLQQIAERAMQQGLIEYDRRHGYRGPVASIELAGWRAALGQLEIPVGRKDWFLGAVLDVEDGRAMVGLADGRRGVLPLSEVRWARKPLRKQYVGPRPEKVSDVVSPGDVIIIEPLGESDGSLPLFGLRQVPEAEGALVAMDPHTGRVLAMVGGYDYQVSEFNRATQAQRQPGSAFKPFVYAAALEQGFTPSSLILDAPFVIDQGYGLGKWKPANYSGRFYGPSTLRLGVEKSRNLMTVRLAQYMGMDKVSEVTERFGIVEKMPETLAMALGAGETTLLKLTSAYAMLVNGGKRIEPTLIDRIQDRRGETIYKEDQRQCRNCRNVTWEQQDLPVLGDDRQVVLDSATAYQVVSMLEGVVERGTGVRIRAVGKPLAGKTGTTNDSQDTWFLGFAPDLAVGVYVGFDNPATLGDKETGSSVAAPVFRDFMKEALEGQPATPFRIPDGVRLVRVDVESGLPADPSDRNVILEAFKPGTEPGGDRRVLDAAGEFMRSDDNADVGTGRLY